MEEYEEEGISLGQIFKVIFRRWKLLLFITGIIFVVGLLGSQLIYNKLKSNYQTTIVYNAIGVNDGTYADGSLFNYRDLVNLETLEKVKASKEEYNNIDVKSMYEKENISISKNIVQDETKTSTSINFSLSARAKYFSSANQAKNFFSDLLNVPVNKTISIPVEANHTVNLDSYVRSNNYDEQIAYLKAQFDYLNSHYDNLISKYGDEDSNISATDNLKISEYKLELNSYFETHKFSELENILTSKKYVKDFSNNRAKLEIRRDALLENIECNQLIIDNLYKQIKRLCGMDEDSTDPVDLRTVPSSEVYSPLTTQIANLVVSITTMQNEVNKINDQIAQSGGNAAEIEAFEKNLNDYYEKLVSETEIYKNVSKSVVQNNTSFNYVSKSITSTGGLSLIISIVLFLVGGFVVAAIVNLILDRKYLKEDNMVQATVAKADIKKEEDEKKED